MTFISLTHPVLPQTHEIAHFSCTSSKKTKGPNESFPREWEDVCTTSAHTALQVQLGDLFLTQLHDAVTTFLNA